MTASMIVALGPQNAYLLKHGLMRSRAVFQIAAIYVLIDACLIGLGALGFGSIISEMPEVKAGFSIVAILFFAFYGVKSLMSAFEQKVIGGNAHVAMRYSTAILISLANPAVLFDTIVIVGGLAGQYESLTDRVQFSIGAATASLLWFSALALASFHASTFVTSDRVWKVLDFCIGVLMIVLALVIWRDVGRDILQAF